MRKFQQGGGLNCFFRPDLDISSAVLLKISAQLADDCANFDDCEIRGEVDHFVSFCLYSGNTILHPDNISSINLLRK